MSALSPVPARHLLSAPAPIPRVFATLQQPLAAVLLLALWLCVVGNLPLWRSIHQLLGGWVHSAPPLMGLGLLVWGATAALLSLLYWPRVFRVFASVLVLVSAANSYFMWQYGTVIDATMLGNIMGTDLREVRDLLSPSLWLCLLLVAGPPLWWVWRTPWAWRRWPMQTGRNLGAATLGLVLAAVALFAAFQSLAPLMRAHKELRYMVNPLNTLYAGGWLLAHQLPEQVARLQPVGEDAKLGASYAQQTKPPLLLLVVGETARAQNWGLNGYARQTTPRLARWQAQGDLVNFPDVSSCGTNTQTSVPCMFSPLTRAQGADRAARMENLLDVLQRAGLAVVWVDNQSGCKGVCDRVPNASTTALQVPKLCDTRGCFDPVMLHQLDQRLAALDPARTARGVVVVMHTMGSHGPAYFNRSPDTHKPFKPECTSNVLTDCSSEQLVNAYDNSIAYADHFLDQSLRWLRQQSQTGAFDTGLLYVSDHGESLGENGLYLHGVPYAFAPKEQTHVPMVAWLSPGLQQRSGLSSGCLRERSNQPLSHDNLFHSVLGLMDIQTRELEPALNLFKPC